MRRYNRLHSHPKNIFDLLENIDKQALVDRGSDTTIRTKESVIFTRGLVVCL